MSLQKDSQAESERFLPYGALIISGLRGTISGSWMVCAIATGVLIFTSVHDGSRSRCSEGQSSPMGDGIVFSYWETSRSCVS